MSNDAQVVAPAGETVPRRDPPPAESARDKQHRSFRYEYGTRQTKMADTPVPVAPSLSSASA